MCVFVVCLRLVPRLGAAGRARVCAYVAKNMKIVLFPASASPGRPWRALTTYKTHTIHNRIALRSCLLRETRVFRSFKSGFCGLELPMVSLFVTRSSKARLVTSRSRFPARRRCCRRLRPQCRLPSAARIRASMRSPSVGARLRANSSLIFSLVHATSSKIGALSSFTKISTSLCISASVTSQWTPTARRAFTGTAFIPNGSSRQMHVGFSCRRLSLRAQNSSTELAESIGQMQVPASEALGIVCVLSTAAWRAAQMGPSSHPLVGVCHQERAFVEEFSDLREWKTAPPKQRPIPGAVAVARRGGSGRVTYLPLSSATAAAEAAPPPRSFLIKKTETETNLRQTGDKPEINLRSPLRSPGRQK